MKLEKRVKYINVKKIDDVVMSGACEVNVFFPIYDKCAAILKLGSKRMVQTYIFINSNLLSYRT